MTESDRGAPVVVGIGPVAADDVVLVARGNTRVVIADDALAGFAASPSRIEALADDPTPYRPGVPLVREVVVGGQLNPRLAP